MKVFYFLYFFWHIYWLSFSAFKRSAEFRADQVAAKKTSSLDFGSALVLVVAFDHYWKALLDKTVSENELQDGSAFVAQLRNGFWDFLRKSPIPLDHDSPTTTEDFRSHPSTIERLRAIGLNGMPVLQKDFFETKPEETWIPEIAQADEWEARFWEDYTEKVKRNHELELAYRYLPANIKEREIVEKCFPPMIYENQAGREMVLKYDSVFFPDRKGEFQWEEIKSVTLEVYKKVHYLRINKQPEGIEFERILIDNYHASRNDIAHEIRRYLGRNQEARAWQKKNKEATERVQPSADFADTNANVDSGQ